VREDLFVRYRRFLNSSTASTAKYVNPVIIILYDQGEVQTQL